MKNKKTLEQLLYPGSRENKTRIRKAGENFKKAMNRLITATKEFAIEMKKATAKT